MKKVYVGGALFSEAEITQRKKEAAELKKSNKLFVFNPIEAPINDKAQLPTAEDIFWGDTIEILTTDYILAELNNKIDEGLVAELAIAWTCNYMRKQIQDVMKNSSKRTLSEDLEKLLEKYPEKEIVAHASDIRINTANSYSGVTIPIGFNQYVIGMLQDGQTKIFTSSEDAIDYIRKDIENGEEKKENK